MQSAAKHGRLQIAGAVLVGTAIATPVVGFIADTVFFAIYFAPKTMPALPVRIDRPSPGPGCPHDGHRPS